MWQTARHGTILGRPLLAMVLRIVGFILTPRGNAQVQLVTMPDRAAVELTIYGGVDLTFAKEQRNITLRQGVDLIQFGWAGTRIDPTSAHLVSVSDPEGVRGIRDDLAPASGQRHSMERGFRDCRRPRDGGLPLAGSRGAQATRRS